MWTGESRVEDAVATIADALHALRRALPAALAGIGLGVVVAAAIVGLRVPDYVATATLLLRPPADPQEQPQRALILDGFASDSAEIENQIQVIGSEQLLRSVYDALRAHEIGTDPAGFQRFAAGVSGRRVGLSNVVAITARSANPEDAARVANAVAAGFLKSRIDTAFADASASRLEARMDDLRNQAQAAGTAMRQGIGSLDILGDADASILTSALVPTSPIAPHAGAMILLATALGLLVPLGIALMRGAADPTIRSDDRLASTFGVGLLGDISELQQTGARSRHEVPVQAATRVLADLCVRGAQSFAVADLTPGFGAQIVAQALARSLADAGLAAEAYVVDADSGSVARLQAGAANADIAHRLGAWLADRPRLVTVLAVPANLVPTLARNAGAFDGVILVAEAGRLRRSGARVTSVLVRHARIPLIGTLMMPSPARRLL